MDHKTWGSLGLTLVWHFMILDLILTLNKVLVLMIAGFRKSIPANWDKTWNIQYRTNLVSDTGQSYQLACPEPLASPFLLKKWATSVSKCCLANIVIPIIKIRWSHDHLISIMGLHVLWMMVFILPQGSVYTVKCHYNTVEYNSILHIPMWWLKQNMDETLNPQKTPHT